MSKFQDKAGKPTLWVTYPGGQKKRFLRGMITHDLMTRGLGFDEAYAAAHSIRDVLSDRGEVTPEEIRDLAAALLEKELGPISERPTADILTRNFPMVVYQGAEQPFSRGLLARSIHGAGVELDRAYRLVLELEAALREEQVETIDSDDVARRVGDLLKRLEGAEAARRYRTIRRLRHLRRPLFVYLGGASGTGKSTLALELAPLLRIYRVTATDTIRQVMRMVFSPQILPALHGSSFDTEHMPPGGLTGDPSDGRGDGRSEEAQRTIAAFTEQAVRVGVGLRAVVDRAVAENMSVLFEGVHLIPSLVPFSDLEGAAYQIPILLSTDDAEAHRSRFLTRRGTGRRGERYIEHFNAIREIHDHLLEKAEIEDTQLIDTSSGDATAQAMRIITGVLRRKVPRIFASSHVAPRTPTLLLIIDGLADRPVRSLGARTPLQAAATPNLDRLAREGQCGLADAIAPGVVPDTAAGSLALFGQSPRALQRGPVEALGADLDLQPGDIALRANFATQDDQGLIIDRRAGRIREGIEVLAAELNQMTLPGIADGEIEIRVRAATEHRLAVVLRGPGLSSSIHGSDPGDGVIPAPPLVPRPEDPNDERAVHTARLLALFEQRACTILKDHPINLQRQQDGLPPANALLSRGAGRVHSLMPLEEAGESLQLACIAGDRTVFGIAKWLGASTYHRKGMTANLDSDLRLKFRLAAKALETADLVIVHVKGADIAAHDQRPDQKVEFLERLDQSLEVLFQRHQGPLRIAVGSDHATLSESGQHAADPLPVLIWGHGIEADQVQSYDETSVSLGKLQRFPLQMLLSRLFDLD